MGSEEDSVRRVPTHLRRVVTGHDRSGRAVIASDGTPPRTDPFKSIPGLVSRLVWSSAAPPDLPFDGVDPTPHVKSFVPGAGESRFLVITFPPDSVFASPDFNPEAAGAENLAVSPGLAELFEPDGMHATPTVDLAIVLEGEIWLELDDGKLTHLKTHDVVVQNGARHAWRNKTERSATIAVVLIGAQRG